MAAAGPDQVVTISTTREKFDTHKARFAEHGLEFVTVPVADSESELLRLQSQGAKVRMVFAIDTSDIAIVFEQQQPRQHPPGSEVDGIAQELTRSSPDFAKLDGMVAAVGTRERASIAGFVARLGPAMGLVLRKHCPSFRALEKYMVTLELSPWVVLTSIGQLFLLSEMLARSVSELVDAIHDESRELRRIAWDIQTGTGDRAGWVYLSLLEDYGQVLSLSAKGTGIQPETRATLESFLEKMQYVNFKYSFDIREPEKHKQVLASGEGGIVRSGTAAGEPRIEEEEEETWTMSRSERASLAQKSLAVFDRLLGRARTVGL